MKRVNMNFIIYFFKTINTDSLIIPIDFRRNAFLIRRIEAGYFYINNIENIQRLKHNNEYNITIAHKYGIRYGLNALQLIKFAKKQTNFISRYCKY